MQEKKVHGMTGKRNAAKDIRKDARVTVRLEHELRSKLSKMADEKGKTLSALIVEILEKSN